MKNVDFGKDRVWRCIIAQMVPLTIAQLVQLLYNVVDRIYIGHLGENHSLALTGIGLAFPMITLILAFTVLFGNGAVPLFSIQRGRGNDELAGKIMGNAFALLIGSSMLLMVVGFVFMKPILFAFGASEASFIYAKAYLSIYLMGTIFSMITTGMNGFISGQGFPKIGMLTVIIGAVMNIILDPVFIFVLDMGVAGAALATVLSQCVSAIWVLKFLFSKKTLISLKMKNIRIQREITWNIIKLGSSNFIMKATNFAVQITCNKMLQLYGGDLYVGIMTLLNSISEIVSLPLTGIVQGSQPVISYNYGANENKRVKEGIRFNTFVGCGYTLIAWLGVVIIPKFWLSIFTEDPQMILTGTKMLQIYFFGFVFMALQFSGQSVFQAVGDAKHAIFFSVLRKIVIVVPLTILLPIIGFGVNGVFLAEPISNVIGGSASYLTMHRTIYKKI